MYAGIGKNNMDKKWTKYINPEKILKNAFTNLHNALQEFRDKDQELRREQEDIVKSLKK